jgi:hypothetical protein
MLQICVPRGVRLTLLLLRMSICRHHGADAALAAVHKPLVRSGQWRIVKDFLNKLADEVPLRLREREKSTLRALVRAEMATVQDWRDPTKVRTRRAFARTHRRVHP